jgi:hypothetical protein
VRAGFFFSIRLAAFESPPLNGSIRATPILFSVFSIMQTEGFVNRKELPVQDKGRENALDGWAWDCYNKNNDKIIIWRKNDDSFRKC